MLCPHLREDDYGISKSLEEGSKKDMLRRDVMRLRTLVKRMLGIATLASAAFTMPAQAASFDCDKAAAPDEKAICADRTLNDQDVRMTVYLEVLGGLQLMGANGEMRDDQREWLQRRQNCGADRQCLAGLYNDRIEKLRSGYQNLAHQRQ